MKTTFCMLAAFAALLAVNVPAVAHHSFAAEFDATKPVTVNGAINKMDWVNPHSWIYVDVKGADGKVVTWRFEMGPPNALLRMGWRKDSIPPGTLVKIEGYRAKSEREDCDASRWPRAVLWRFRTRRAQRGGRSSQTVDAARRGRLTLLRTLRPRCPLCRYCGVPACIGRF